MQYIKKLYKMQSIDHFIGAVANYISERSNKNGKYYFSKIDLKIAYSRKPIDTQLTKQPEHTVS